MHSILSTILSAFFFSIFFYISIGGSHIELNHRPALNNLALFSILSHYNLKTQLKCNELCKLLNSGIAFCPQVQAKRNELKLIIII